MPDPATLAYYARRAAERAVRYEAADLRSLHALMLATCPQGGTALDVGCGSGRDVAMLCAQGRDAIGVDASEAMLAEARRLHPEIGERLSMDALPGLDSLGDRRFGLVCATAVLMHVEPDELFLALRRLRSLLAPAGTLLLSIPEPGAVEGRPPEDVDEQSRLFAWHEPADVRLRCERLGLVLVGEHRDGDGCHRRRRWRVLHFRLDEAAQRSVDEIEAVIHRDRKSATYKFALLRALCDIAQTMPRAVRWQRRATADGAEPSEWVVVPVGLIVQRWLDYYWPIVTAPRFVAQLGGEGPRSGSQLAFRAALVELTRAYPGGNGVLTFRAALRQGSLGDATPLLAAAAGRIRDAIRDGPVVHAGGAMERRMFGYVGGPLRPPGARWTASALANSPAGVLVEPRIWRELSLMGHWIEGSLVMRWARHTTEMCGSNGQLELGDAAALLVGRPDAERETLEAREAYLRVPDLRCVWTDRRLSKATLAVDHMIPFAVWPRNDLWNLLPAQKAVNRQKSDRIVRESFLESRRDALVGCWETLHAAHPEQFLAEVRLALAPTVSDQGGLWKDAAWAGLLEQRQVVQGLRGLATWPHDLPAERTRGRPPSARVPAAAPPGLLDASDVRPFENAIPAYPNLFVAAGRFSDEQLAHEVPGVGDAYDPAEFQWVAPPAGHRPARDLFVARVTGESMNCVVQDGQWALFRLHPKGTREGKVVVVRQRAFVDPEGGQFTLKRYRSVKAPDGEDAFRHVRIELHPDSSDPRFEPIVLDAASEDEFAVLAELLAPVPG